MKLLTLLLILCFSCDLLISQNAERVEVNGTIFADNNDVENVTIYNTSLNNGTITNSEGEFTLKVGLNDIIEVSALQFKAVTVKVTKDVLATKRLKIYLTEHINQLDAVLLKSGLTGNLDVDINEAEELPVMQLDLGNLDALEFFDDKAFDNKVVTQELDRAMGNNTFANGVDFARLFGLNKLLNRKKKENKHPVIKKPKDILDVYSHKFISETCNIPQEKVEAFVAFINPRDIEESWYKLENEMYLIDFLVKQGKEFLKIKDEKR